MNAQTLKLELAGPSGALQGLRDSAFVPEGVAPRGVAVIAHPHPLFGGTMDNKVVQTLARAFVQSGWDAVRFNFRGVGASAGAWDEGRGEIDDFLAVLEQQAPQGPIAIAGFLSAPTWPVMHSRPSGRVAWWSVWSWSVRRPRAFQVARVTAGCP